LGINVGKQRAQQYTPQALRRLPDLYVDKAKAFKVNHICGYLQLAFDLHFYLE